MENSLSSHGLLGMLVDLCARWPSTGELPASHCVQTLCLICQTATTGGGDGALDSLHSCLMSCKEEPPLGGTITEITSLTAVCY